MSLVKDLMLISGYIYLINSLLYDNKIKTTSTGMINSRVIVSPDNNWIIVSSDTGIIKRYTDKLVLDKIITGVHDDSINFMRWSKNMIGPMSIDMGGHAIEWNADLSIKLN